MAYKFMLGALPLPIPPSSLSISTPSTNQTVTLINDGEINIPKPAGLREISFEFLLPTFQKYPFEDYRIGNYTAATFINYLRLWKFTKYPIPFIVVRMSPAGKFLYFTSIMCLIEDFTFNEDAEELGFDTKCSITLKEYFFYGTRRIEVKQKDGKKTATVKNTRSTADRVKKTEIKPKEGESVISAAKREGYTIDDLHQMKYDQIVAGEEIVYNKQDMMFGGSGYDSNLDGIKLNLDDGVSLVDTLGNQQTKPLLVPHDIHVIKESFLWVNDQIELVEEVIRQGIPTTAPGASITEITNSINSPIDNLLKSSGYK